MQKLRAAASEACCCEEEEEGSLPLLLSLLFPPTPPPAFSSLTSNSSGQFFPVMNSRARTSGGTEASRAPSSTAMPFKTSICPCGPPGEENGAEEEEAAAATALGLSSEASTHPTTLPAEGSMRATQGVPQTFAQSSPSAREALPSPPLCFVFFPLPPPPRPKSEGGPFAVACAAAAAVEVSSDAAAAAVAAEEEEEEEDEEELELESRDLTALAGTHSSSLRLKTSTRFLAFLSLPPPPPSSPSPPPSLPSSSVTVIVRRALETLRTSTKVILDEPSERAIAEAAWTKAAPQPSPSGVLASSEIFFRVTASADDDDEVDGLFFAAAPPPVLRLSASSMAPPMASTGFLGAPLLLSVEFRRASTSCQKALPDSQVSWRSLEEEEEEEDEFLSPPPNEEGTLVSPSPKASSGSLAVRRTLPDARSTSLTVDLPLRPVLVRGGWARREREEERERETGVRKREKKKKKRTKEKEQTKNISPVDSQKTSLQPPPPLDSSACGPEHILSNSRPWVKAEPSWRSSRTGLAKKTEG